MADNPRSAGQPTGSPYDIAMMAYRIAEQVLVRYEQHESDCHRRWIEQREAMDALKNTASINFQSAARDRQDFRKKLDYISAFLIKAGIGLIGAMFTVMLTMGTYLFLHR